LRIEKPWGYEEVLSDNGAYVMKFLYMHQGHQCSLQYHEFKSETVYVVAGELEIEIGSDVKDLSTIRLRPSNSVYIAPHTIHRMRAVMTSSYIEASTCELDDVVRLEDSYGRV
jgi:mannose-6-phosphate isomerase